MPAYKAIIRGAYGEGNFGDDVLMLVCHWLLRQLYEPEEIAFIFTSLPPEKDRRYVTRLLPELNLIRYEVEAAAELVVWGGGTQFYSFPKMQPAVPFYRKAIAGLFNPRKAFNYFAKRLFGGKFNPNQRFAALGVGVGPFVRGSVAESYTRDLFRAMDCVAVRDDDSMRLCDEWGIEGATQRSDLAFVQGPWWPELPPAVARSGSRRIGIIVRDWTHDESGAAYEQPVLNVAATLRKKGDEVTFISFRPHGDTSWADLLDSRGESWVGWEPEKQTVAEFFELLGGFDCLLTARYHGAIFGALLGRAVVCIEIEPKLRLVSELLSVGLWRKPFDEAACLELLDEVFERPRPVREATTQAVAEQRRLGSLMMQEFLAFAGGAGTEPALEPVAQR